MALYFWSIQMDGAGQIGSSYGVSECDISTPTDFINCSKQIADNITRNHNIKYGTEYRCDDVIFIAFNRL